MINASKEFKEKLKNGADLVNYADITLSDGTVLNLTYKDFIIGGCSIVDKTTDGKFGVGFAIGKTLSIKIANYDERFSQYDFYQAIINLYVGMRLDNGNVEKIRKGVFYATVPETSGDVITIGAVDGMYKLDKNYSFSTTAYPATLQTIISDVCLDCGILIGFTQFDNMNFVVQEKPETGTYRQILSYACQIAGYNAHINNNGYMQLVWYDSKLLSEYNYTGGSFKIYPHNTILDGGNFKDYKTENIVSGGNFKDIPDHIFRVKSLNVHTDDVQITGVRVTGENEKIALFGEEGYLIEIKNNPFVAGHEQEIANYLGNRVVGMVFRPFTAQILSNPLYEPFEVVRILGRKGNVYNSIIDSVTYKIGGYTQISCQAEDPVRNGSAYFSSAAQAVVEARRNAEKQLTTYDKAVQNMNQIAANAMGFHTTYEDQEDGSRITYLHDKPKLKDSKTIYKQTIDGFFISTDGGKSYTAGFDKNGNAIVNILYAIGIVCDWIRGGTLTLGGMDNVNGMLDVLDSNGNKVMQIRNNLVSFVSNIFQLQSTNCTITKEGKLTANEAVLTGKLTSYGSENRQAIIDTGEAYIYYANNRLRLSGSTITFYDNSYVTTAAITGAKNSAAPAADGGYISLYDSSNKAYFVASPQTGMVCTKTKSRLASTKSYSDRLLYCYEMAKPYFGDIGEAVLDDFGYCYIFFDDIFSETINSDFNYFVFLQKYGEGNIWVEKKFYNYFVVKGEPGLSFAWEIKCVQKEYEYERMEKFENINNQEAPDYEFEAQKYVENYYKEMLNYEESN